MLERLEGWTAALDRGRVLIAPYRTGIARGQDSMKLCDYAARGRPIACTRGALGPPEHTAGAGVLEADTPAEFADAVRRAASETWAGGTQLEWVRGNGWSARWPLWRAAAEGSGLP